MQLATGTERTRTPAQLLQPPKPWTDLQGSAGRGGSLPLTKGRLPLFRVKTLNFYCHAILHRSIAGGSKHTTG